MRSQANIDESPLQLEESFVVSAAIRITHEPSCANKSAEARLVEVFGQFHRVR